MKELYLAGGSYYGIQEVFSRLRGVADTTAGWAAGAGEADGAADEAACVRVVYDPKKIDITMLLHVFFAIVNPGVRAADPRYRTGVYYTDGEDLMQLGCCMAFFRSRGRLRAPGTPEDFDRDRPAYPDWQTELQRLGHFRPAPEAEQYYLRKHPGTESAVNIALLEALHVILPAEKMQ